MRKTLFAISIAAACALAAPAFAQVHLGGGGQIGGGIGVNAGHMLQNTVPQTMQTAQQMEQGAFARAGRALEREEIAAIQLEADAAQDFERARSHFVALVEIARLEDCAVGGGVSHV